MTHARPTFLLAVFAHPDDEAFSSGGTLAYYAEKGVNITLACANRGEAGKITDPSMTVTDLGQQREEELKAACRVLGIPAPVFLDFHDSGRAERVRADDPLALMNVDPFEVETKVLTLIERVRPQVMLTFDPHGGYGHIDHLVVHRAASAAFFSGGARYAGLSRLFFTAMPVEFAARFKAMGQTMPYEAERYGVSDTTVAVRVDVRAYAERKMAALRAHGTQTGPTSRMGQLSEEEQQKMRGPMLASEAFSLGGTRGPIERYPLRGMFDGLEGFSQLDG